MLLPDAPPRPSLPTHLPDALHRSPLPSRRSDVPPCRYLPPKPPAHRCAAALTRSGKMKKERLMKMTGAVPTGVKGTVRRKKKAVHKTATSDDKS